MRKLLLISALILPLCGCTAFGGDIPLANGQSISASNPAVSLEATKLLTATHQAYNALGQILLDNARSGVLHGDNAAKAKVWYDKADDALDVADKAKAASDESGILAAVAKAKSAIASAKSLLGVN